MWPIDFIRLIACTSLLVSALTNVAAGQVTSRVSVATGGAEGNFGSGEPSISGDGRYVAFWSRATNLVTGDTTGMEVFVHDRQSGTTELVSVATGGAEGNGDSGGPSISGDGRYVAFWSHATNLVSGDTNGAYDIFVHDRQSGTTERVSVASNGTQGNGTSLYPTISADGRYVAFESTASNLVAGDTNDVLDVFVRDRQSGTTERASVDSSEVQGNHNSAQPSISADGRFVAFHSFATNLVTGDTNGTNDVFVRDRQSGTTERSSVDSSEVQGNHESAQPSISDDGRFVAFHSFASNLVTGDTNGTNDVFVRDRQDGSTERSSVDAGGADANDESTYASVSPDGRYVAFHSQASNLVSGDTNGWADVFLRDRQVGTTERVSVARGGVQGDGDGIHASVSADAGQVAFYSWASNLVSGDTNVEDDVFVRDREASPPFSATCFGEGSGAPCGCGNEAAPGSGGGCANASPMPAAQGARLSAAGTSSTAADDLVLTVDFTTNQPGLFFQGNNAIGGGAGVTFGDGIRCCGGSVVRLEIADPPGAAGPKTASTTQPILGTSPAGTTAAGDTRCYQWWYRNPGTSPCGSNFNLSNALVVAWAP